MDERSYQQSITSDASTLKTSGPYAEVFKAFGITKDQPCRVVLPAVLKKYNIHASWRGYQLYIVSEGHRHLIGWEEKPLLLFKKLEQEGRRPMLMLRRSESTEESPNARDSVKDTGDQTHSRTDYARNATLGRLDMLHFESQSNKETTTSSGAVGARLRSRPRNPGTSRREALAIAPDFGSEGVKDEDKGARVSSPKIPQFTRISISAPRSFSRRSITCSASSPHPKITDQLQHKPSSQDAAKPSSDYALSNIDKPKSKLTSINPPEGRSRESSITRPLEFGVAASGVKNLATTAERPNSISAADTSEQEGSPSTYSDSAWTNINIGSNGELEVEDINYPMASLARHRRRSRSTDSWSSERSRGSSMGVRVLDDTDEEELEELED